MEQLPDALPQNTEQLVTMVVSLLVTIVLAFLRGRKVGHDKAIDGKD